MAFKTAVIVNPYSAGGRTGARWPSLSSVVERQIGDFATFQTQRPGHASDLVRQALCDGYDRILSVGGDGTHHEVINGFFDGLLPVNPRAVLAILPLGTGSDLARTLGLPSGEAAVPYLDSDRVVHADLGRVTFSSPDGAQNYCYFINTCHIGMGGAVARRVNLASKKYGGFCAYLSGVLGTLLSFRNPFMQIDVDGLQLDQVSRDIIIANGQYDGAGMHVAPMARLDSGHFEVFILDDFGRFESLRSIPLLYKGRILDKADRIKHFQATRVTVRSRETVFVNLDGEQPGALPASVEVVPKAIRLVVPE